MVVRAGGFGGTGRIPLQRSLKVETIVHPLMVSPGIGVTDVRKLGGPGGSLPLGSSSTHARMDRVLFLQLLILQRVRI